MVSFPSVLTHPKAQSGFPSGLFWHFTIEKHRSGPVWLLGNAYLVVWNVGMTHAYANEKEEQPRGFAGRNFKDSTIEEYNTVKKIFLYVMYYFG